jgi:hypothetical protein
MIECTHCNGFGSSFKDPGDGRCSKCGGTGLKPEPACYVSAPKLTKLVKISDPLCQELQNGHNSYGDGLVLAKSHRVNRDPKLTSVGSWLVEHDGRLANVHPIQDRLDSIKQHDGLNVYGIRFWEFGTC